MTINRKLLKIVCLLLFSCCFFTAITQVPVGLPIDVEDTVIAFRLSEDGSHLTVVRSEHNFDDDSNDLIANKYEWNGTDWLSIGESPPLLEVATPWYTLHATIADDANRIAIYSQYIHDFNATFLSAVQVFEWTGSSWEQVGENLPSATSIDFSADGTRIALGKPSLNTHDVGTAEIYEWNGENWLQMGQSFEGTHEWEHLGNVKLSGDGTRLAIGSSGFQNGPARESGIIRTYDWDGTTWVQLQNDLISPASDFSLASNGNRIRSIRRFEEQVDQFDWNGNSWEPSANTVSDLGQLAANGQRMIDKEAKTYQWNNAAWIEVAPALFVDPPFYNLPPELSADGNRIAVYLDGAISIYEFEFTGFIYELPTICSNVAPLTFQQAVYPFGGTFTGPGVVPGTTPGSFLIDPAVVGIGTHIITYAVAGETYTSSFTIVAPVPPTLSLPDTLINTTVGLTSIHGSGLPQGGKYQDGQGYITDDGNGLTFTLNAFAETVSTNITYTVEDVNGCTVSVTKEVVLLNEFTNGGNPYPHQIGSDLWGEEGEGQLGYAVSLSADGTRMAVSAPQVGWGEVYVYQRNESGWVQMGNDIVGQILQGRFGHAIKLSADGNRLIVGIPAQITSDPYRIVYSTGAFQVYEWDGMNWDTLGSEYQNFGWDTNTMLGKTLACSHDGSVVASTMSFATVNKAKVLVYRDTGDGMGSGWPPINGSTPQFGEALALSASGNRIVVGEPGSNSGKIHVYDWNVNSWHQAGQLIEQPSAEDHFGAAVAISADGNRVVVGAPQIDQPDLTGYVQVYDWDGSGWLQAGTDIPGAIPGENFGQSVAISADGSRIVVGAPNSEGAGPNAGRVAVYQWSDNNWEEQENTIIGGDSAGDQFGFSVAASAFGNIVAVGAPQDSVHFGRGYARVFGSTDPNFQNALAPICADAPPRNNLSGGIPFGGVYSGAGVNDNGDGTTFNFDPTVTEPGLHTITYTVDTTELSNTIEVLPLPELSIALPDTVFVTGGTPLSITGNGLPAGGTYTSESFFFQDNGDGLTFNFTGAYSFTELSTITYTYTNEAGCTNSISAEILLFDLATGVADLEQLGIKIFPNPTSGKLYLRGKNLQSITLFAQNGSILRQQMGAATQLDLTDYPNGSYYLLVKLKDGSMGIQQIIKG